MALQAQNQDRTLTCKRCRSGAFVKNGFVRGHQRYRCKECGYNFTDTPPRGLPLSCKVTALMLYLSGLSMNRTAALVGVSTPTVQDWIERFAAAFGERPEPSSPVVVVELDELWHFVKKSAANSGFGSLAIVQRGDWLIGNAAVVTGPPSSGCGSV